MDMHCEKSWMLDLMASLIYLGCFFGYISLSILVDNMGRWRSLLLTLVLSTGGLIMAALANNLYVLGIGLFITGFGTDSGVNICFYFIAETMEAKNRQKYSIIIQIFFSLGGVFNIGYYYVLRNWRIVAWVFLIAPSLVCIVVIYKMVKDTPYFLIKLYESEEIIKQLSYIYKLNHNGEDIGA